MNSTENFIKATSCFLSDAFNQALAYRHLARMVRDGAEVLMPAERLGMKDPEPRVQRCVAPEWTNLARRAYRRLRRGGL